MFRKGLGKSVSLLVILALFLTACGGGSQPSSSGGAQSSSGSAAPATPAAPAAPKKLTIAFSVPAMSFPFFVFLEKQVKDEAGKLGNIEIITLDAENKVPKQTADLEAAIAKKVDAVIISPIDAEAMKPGVEQVLKAGIPVLTVDRSVKDVKVLAHVGADNVLGGEEEGKLIQKLFPGGAKVFVLQGQPGSSPMIDRGKGIHNILDKSADKHKIVFEQVANFRRDEGLKVTEAGLAKEPNPDAILAHNDEMAFGAVEAVKAKGLAGKVKVIGYDALPEALQMVKDGSMYATIDQFPGQQARTALKVAVDFLRNQKKPEKEAIFITPKAITKENLSEAERASEVK